MKETVRACPHGHTSVRRNSGGFGTKPAKAEFYCRTCGNKHTGGGRQNPHYERKDLIEKARRVNETLDYDVKTGYVWSPSHDEREA